MKAILFDCDGTLADSFGIIIGTMQAVFELSGLPVPSVAAVRPVIGLSLPIAIHRLAPSATDEEIGTLTDLYRTTFHAMRNDQAFDEALFPGIEPMLRRLAARDDIHLGMVTGKSRRGVRMILEQHGLEPIFRTVRTADDCPSKPHPAMVSECCDELGVAPLHCVVVGDSIYDMEMAVAAGAMAYGVTWGSASAQDLSAAGARAVFDSVGALSDALRQFAGPVPAHHEATA